MIFSSEAACKLHWFDQNSESAFDSILNCLNWIIFNHMLHKNTHFVWPEAVYTYTFKTALKPKLLTLKTMM